MRRLAASDPLERYTAASELAASQIIGSYSTSFTMATKLLGSRHRGHVRNIYALVRVADELVDGVAAGVRMPIDEQRAALDALEDQTVQAIRDGYSSNPVVHAFACTARIARIDNELTKPFFASMRTDLDAWQHRSGEEAPAGSLQEPEALLHFSDAGHADYVHGSAEVVGLMCLRVFVRDEELPRDVRDALAHGARRLGAAFQNVNFLRDIGDDTARLGRGYLSPDERLTRETQQRWVSTIREQLADAQAVLPLLPADARAAVACALGLFAELADRLADTPPDELYRRRVRIGALRKAWLTMRAVVQSRNGGA